MAVRLIAIDLDGTLLHDDMTISNYSRQVIKKAQSRGYEIVVATGRMWDSAKARQIRSSWAMCPLSATPEPGL